MDLRRLEVFCKVVELKSFTKAAEALRLSQPTVSEHISTLEKALGEKLVDRLGREVLPTPAGRVLYQYARNIIQMSEEAVQALAQFKGHLAGHLVIGASTIPGTYFLPKLMASFKEAHPAVRITVKIGDSAEIAEDVVIGNSEVGVIGSPVSERRLTLEELFSDELVLAVPPGHPWASRGRIHATELVGEPFITRQRGSGTRAVTTRILEDHGFDVSTLRVIVEFGSTEAVRQGIKAGIGISILSRLAVADDLEHELLAIAEIDNIKFSRPLYLVQRKNRQPSPVVLAFLDHLRRSARPRVPAETSGE